MARLVQDESPDARGKKEKMAVFADTAHCPEYQTSAKCCGKESGVYGKVSQRPQMYSNECGYIRE